VLSGDEAMLDVLSSGDMYLEFAKLAGWCPADATKATHRAARDRAKPCVLALGYGMGPNGLALKMGTSQRHAIETMRAYARRFPAYWAWAEHQMEIGDGCELALDGQCMFSMMSGRTPCGTYPAKGQARR
jgi:DNA polymerase I